MNVKILASGSKGNCIYIEIESGGAGILVDSGIPKTKIEKRLLDEGIRPDEILAIFITHAHKDHVQGLPLANKYRIPVWATEGEWKSIQCVDDDLKRIMPIGLEQCGFHAGRIKTHHDAYDPCGYVFTLYGDTAAEDIKVSICLDTGKVDSEMLEAMKDSDIYIIEANHDPAMVEVSAYPLSVQGRILSDIGHLSNEQTADALKRLIRGVGERIYLTHLSSSNNMPALAEMTVKRALKQKGFEAGKHYFLEVL
jgi:phosphoribosyl 1,2-cyclic phosphodiesterase